MSRTATLKPFLLFVVVFVATAFLPWRVYAQYWVNGQAASYVTGQTGFGLNGSALTASGLSIPVGVAVDSATGKVFVSDIANNRVLRYPSVAALSDGTAAEAVLGQPDFITNTVPATPSATSFNTPLGLAVDRAGNLWVADNDNNRVLRFANAATIANGAAASGVLGWPDFVTNAAPASPIYSNGALEPPTAASLDFPEGVFCKGTTLWVADYDNNRILRFDSAAWKANGGNADAVFGAPNFTYEDFGDQSLGAWGVARPTQVYVDQYDNLWEAENFNNRVMMFPNASTGGSNASDTTPYGESATLVLGQSNFGTYSAGTTASTMNAPWGIYGDAAGNIYVGEYFNNRILVFANAANLSNGAAATYVLGQPDFVSNGSGDGANQLSTPGALFIPASGTFLMAADAYNNRVLTYIPLTVLPLSLISFTGSLQENGQVLLQWQISDDAAPGTVQPDSTELEYATNAASGFTDVLNQQPISPGLQNYSYLQVSPAPGANYYRLKLVQAGGAVTYSQVVVVTVPGGATKSTGLSIYPNPAQSSIVVKVPQAGTAEIDIYSSAGMLMQRLETGAAVNNIDISRFAAGVYMVTVVQGGSTVSGSFVKM